MPLIELSDAVKVVDGYKRRNPDSWSLCNSIRCDIEELSTISPDEVRGVGKREQSPYTGFSRCSVCKDCYIESYWIEDGKWQYCPRCGSKMEVSEDA